MHEKGSRILLFGFYAVAILVFASSTYALIEGPRQGPQERPPPPSDNEESTFGNSTNNSTEIENISDSRPPPPPGGRERPTIPRNVGLIATTVFSATTVILIHSRSRRTTQSITPSEYGVMLLAMLTCGLIGLLPVLMQWGEFDQFSTMNTLGQVLGATLVLVPALAIGFLIGRLTEFRTLSIQKHEDE